MVFTLQGMVVQRWVLVLGVFSVVVVRMSSRVVVSGLCGNIPWGRRRQRIIIVVVLRKKHQKFTAAHSVRGAPSSADCRSRHHCQRERQQPCLHRHRRLVGFRQLSSREEGSKSPAGGRRCQGGRHRQRTVVVVINVSKKGSNLVSVVRGGAIVSRLS